MGERKGDKTNPYHLYTGLPTQMWRWSVFLGTSRYQTARGENLRHRAGGTGYWVLAHLLNPSDRLQSPLRSLFSGDCCYGLLAFGTSRYWCLKYRLWNGFGVSKNFKEWWQILDTEYLWRRSLHYLHLINEHLIDKWNFGWVVDKEYPSTGSTPYFFQYHKLGSFSYLMTTEIQFSLYFTFVVLQCTQKHCKVRQKDGQKPNH